jgi:hypothetical protein
VVIRDGGTGSSIRITVIAFTADTPIATDFGSMKKLKDVLAKILVATLDRLGNLAVWYLRGWQPVRLEMFIQQEAQKQAAIISRQVVMQYLDHQRMLHCYVCPTRYGLIKRIFEKDDGSRQEVYLCPAHQRPHETNGSGPQAVAAGQGR